VEHIRFDGALQLNTDVFNKDAMSHNAKAEHQQNITEETEGNADDK